MVIQAIVNHVQGLPYHTTISARSDRDLTIMSVGNQNSPAVILQITDDRIIIDAGHHRTRLELAHPDSLDKLDAIIVHQCSSKSSSP